MPVSVQKPWKQMSLEERIDHLNAVLDDFIAFQNGANARMSARIQALEQALEQIGKYPFLEGKS